MAQDEHSLFTLCDSCNQPIDPSNCIIVGDPLNPVPLPAPDVDCVYQGTFCGPACFSYRFES